MVLTFDRFRREHSRLHDPEVLQSSYELVASAPAARVAGKGNARSRAVGKGKARPGARRVREDGFEVAPKIYVADSRLSCNVPLFGDMLFETRTPESERVELLWAKMPWDGSAPRRAQMDSRRGGQFVATVGLDDGKYLFAFSADGCVRPDPAYAQRLALTQYGPFAPLRLSRHMLPLELENRGAADELVRIESDAPWLAPPDWFRLEPSAKTGASVRVLPELMPEGECSARLTVSTGVDDDRQYEAVRVDTRAEAGGAVPTLSVTPEGLGWITQGLGRVELGVVVEARGRGPLTGMLMVRHMDEVADFRIDVSEGLASFEHVFRVDTARLPYRAEGKLAVTLLNDSYLANYRQLQVEVPYRLLYLKKSMPALSYGLLRKGATRTLRLEVVRSDEQELDLQVSLPDAAAGYLEAYRVRPNVYSFRFDTRGVAPGRVLNETIELTDRLSGVSDRVKVLAEVER